MFTYPIGLFNFKVLDPEVDAWKTRVISNGGSVSPITLDRVNTFVLTLKATGLRSRFLRLNLFVGDDLAACLTPLFLNGDESLSVFLGNIYDVNTGFVEANYTESGASGGLTNDTALKWLSTGLNPFTTPEIVKTTSGLLFYFRNITNGGLNPYFLGCWDTSSQFDIQFRLNKAAYRAYSLGFAQSTTTITKGLIIAKTTAGDGTSNVQINGAVGGASGVTQDANKINFGIDVFGSHRDGANFNPVNGVGNCYGITNGIANDTEGTTIATLLNDFYTDFSRNEY